MEEILIVIITFLGKLLIESLLYFPLDIFIIFREKYGGVKADRFGWVLLSLLAGIVIGGVSVVLFSNAVLPFGWLRVLSLIMAPFLAGAIALRMSRRRNQKHLNSDNKLHYMAAFLFTLGLLGIRFIFTTRI